ncbi:MAG: dTDP-4-dehydrorhamnose reductase [Succinivibrionaceae bacterium]|nr:dTDP-4-dehydrorhamnose reductase [Succinivibrionaceae bacterium]
MRILVLGAGGQLGGLLARRCGELNIPCVALSRAELDITDGRKLAGWIDDACPDVLVNAAAYTDVEAAEDCEAEAARINAEALRTIGTLCRDKAVPVIHISTDFVYDGKKMDEYLETDEAVPLNAYGRSKLAGDRLLSERADRYIILRLSWLFARGGRNFVAAVLGRMMRGMSLSVVDDQVGGPTYAGDASSCILEICRRICADGGFSSWGVYHYAGKPDVSRYEFAEFIAEAALKAGIVSARPAIAPVSSSGFPSKVVRPRNSRLNVDKIRRVFGIGPSDWKGEILRHIGDYAMR